MADLLATLPAQFHVAFYDGSRIPDDSHDLSRGANCQRYAFAVLAHFGRLLPPWRSSELWADSTLTTPVAEFGPLDLLMFNRTGDAFGAHVAVYAGAGQALHLCKAVGQPVMWSIEQFLERPDYRVLIGGKRVRTPAPTRND